MLEIWVSRYEPIDILDHAVLGFMCSQSKLEFPLEAKFPLKSGAKVKRQQILNLKKQI